MGQAQEKFDTRHGHGKSPAMLAEDISNSGLVSALDRWLPARMLSLLGNPPFGFKLWNGEQVVPRGVQPRNWVRVRDHQSLVKLVVNPGLHFGELYSSGALQIEGDFWNFMEKLIGATEVSDRNPHLLWRLICREPRRNRNTVEAARENIHRHYDLGNDFYRLWLDRAAMQYTCAYYASPNMTLEQAQVAKLNHVSRKLQLRPGETVLETGCGWGGLALHMAHHYGVKVKAFNISWEQVEYAREQAVRQGLADRVEYILDDYRNAHGQFDVFVSVGMLEHVGPEHYHQLGGVIHRCLKPDGRGLIHSVGNNFRRPMNEWLQRRIFPGSYVPTLREMMKIFEPHGFSVLDVENLRRHYGLTLKAWLERFEPHVEEVGRRYGRDFVRAWRLYLAGCGASFNVGALQLFQIVFAHGDSNALPWTRRHLYEIRHPGE